MIYKYFHRNNFEDFSSGRVFYHKPNYSNYPVRLAGEVFCRCLEYIDKKNDIVIYDPCCGSGYMLTVLGYLFNEKIKAIYASDISNEAVELAGRNFSLLSNPGIEKRKIELLDLYSKYGKESHKEAIKSLDNIRIFIKQKIEVNCYTRDIFNKDEIKSNKFTADIIMTDVPYGNLVNWSNQKDKQIEKLLDMVKSSITVRSIVSISHTKSQKIDNKSFHKINLLKVGHRSIDFIRLK